MEQTITDAYQKVSDISDSINEQLENLKSLENLLPKSWF
jgi:hypothetical protein